MATGTRGTSRTKSTLPAPKRAAIYVRVSSDEQVDGYSLSAQERAARLYAEAHEWEIVERYADEGKSAWTDDISKRPEFARMLEDAQAGRFDVLIVHKLDRFARNVRLALETLHTLERHHVGFVSLSESMDFSTPIGRVILSTLAAFAEYYSHNLSAETSKGKAERKRQGMYNGLIPFGMVKGDDGIPIAHPDNYAGLLLAFELAAQGSTDRAIARALNEAGYRTSGNRGANAFTKDTIRPMLQNRFYLGELPGADGEWLPGKHEAVLSPALFAEAQRTRAARASRKEPYVTENRSPWALSGVGTCSCGASLKASGGKARRRRCECAGRVQGTGCTAASFYIDLVEAQLGSLLEFFAIPAADRERALADWSARQRSGRQEERERDRLAQRIERAKELYLDGQIEKPEYQKMVRDLETQLAQMPPADAVTPKRIAKRVAHMLENMAETWQVANQAERNAIARALFFDVVIEDRSIVAVKPKPEFLPLFEAIAGDFAVRTVSVPQERKRRDSVFHLRQEFGYVTIPAELLDSLMNTGENAHSLPAGRSSKLSTDDRNRIAALSSEGASLRTIAKAVGVSHETVRLTLAAG